MDCLLGLIGILGVALTGAAVAGARLTQQSELAFGAAAILLVSLTASALYADQLIRVTVPSRWIESAVARRGVVSPRRWARIGGTVGHWSL